MLINVPVFLSLLIMLMKPKVYIDLYFIKMLVMSKPSINGTLMH